MIWDWLKNAARRHARDEAGASLVEYTVVIILFMLIFFAILDFGRLGFNWVMTEKAMQRATRIAATRPPACAGVPETVGRTSAATAFGTLCRSGTGVCAVPAGGAVQQCRLGAPTEFTATNPCTAPVNVPTLGNNPNQADIDARDAALRAETRQEIWCLLEPILPSNADPSNIRVTYTYNDDLGFVGGPYVPMVEIGTVTAATEGNIAGSSELRFEFITPIPALIAAVGGAATNLGQDNNSNSLADIPFPDLSVAMPGEDLNRGDEG